MIYSSIRLFIITIIGILMCFCSDQKNPNSHIDETLYSTSDSTLELAWELSSYNFGGLEELSVSKQVSILRDYNYDGIILRAAKDHNFEDLPDFLQEADKYEDFKIHSAFVRYNFDDEDKKERWTEVVDQIAGKSIQLWVIFGKKIPGFDDDFISSKLNEIVTYASSKHVHVVLYPHSSTYFESIEEGLPFLIPHDKDDLSIAFHLYHEIRAGNGHRIHKVLDIARERLGAVTLAGSDSVADYTNSSTRDTSTIKPIGKGTYDLKGLLKNLKQINYAGPIGIMNFSIKEDPNVYLPKSKELLDDYLQRD